MMKSIIFIFLTILFSIPSFCQGDVSKTYTHNLKNGDSLVIYESRIISSDIDGPVNNNGGKTPLNSLFSSHPDTKFYSRTSKYVIKKDSGNYKLICYVSDKNRYPNFGFDRQIKKDEKWHFKKYAEKKLAVENVNEICLLEMEAIKKEIDQYDEGDVSKSMIVIKSGKKVICSSYYAAFRLDKIMESK